MPPAPGESTADYEKRKKEQQKAEDEKKAAAKAKDEKKKKEKAYQKEYAKKADPTTVEELVDADELVNSVFKEGEWRPAWGIVEYFPAGTSFQGGVMVPLHARMVNILPAETKPAPLASASESLCSIQ
ncbi:hypothetical protein P7C73_g6490, partial [Tremellales sp. Uapishka_1]